MSKRSIRISSPWLAAPVLLALAVFGALVVQPHSADARSKSTCPRREHHRTAQQIIEQHLALMQAGNMEAAICDYAEDAVVILPGQTIRGREAIGQGLLGMVGVLGGALPQVHTLTAAGSVVMITFSADGTPCTVPDGSDTYIVEHGQIVAQTVHDTLYSAEGTTCPMAAPGE
jgi:ketosteroid isomerase-like protein